MVLGHGNHTSTQILEELSLRSSGQSRIWTRDAAALMMTNFKGSPRVLDGMLLGPHRALECDSKADSDPMVRTQHGTACGRSVAGGRDAESRPARLAVELTACRMDWAEDKPVAGAPFPGAPRRSSVAGLKRFRIR